MASLQSRRLGPWWLYVVLICSHLAVSGSSGLCQPYRPDTLSFNCSSASLGFMPKDIPKDTAFLLLSHNIIRKVSGTELSKLPRLTHLDLSYNNITYLDKDTLAGLHKLCHIDLTFNPLSYASFTPDIFSDQQDSLRVLMLTTDTIQNEYPTETLKILANLQELHINGINVHEFPYEIAQLPLRVLNLQCPGQKGPRMLTKHWLRHLRNSTVEDLSFYFCGIREVEFGAFKDFQSLHTLNVGANPFEAASMAAAIHPLSSLGSTPLHTLILDDVLGYFGTPDLELKGDTFRNDIGDRIQRLSLQYNLIQDVDLKVFYSLKNITHLAFGFNAIQHYNIIPSVKLNNLLSVLFPKLVTFDICYSHPDYRKYRTIFKPDTILSASDFFKSYQQKIKDEWKTDVIHPRSQNLLINVTKRSTTLHTVLVNVSQNLRAVYAKGSALGNFIGYNDLPVIVGQPNNIEVADFSESDGKRALYALFGFYGLNNLKVLDLGHTTQESPDDTFSKLEGCPVPEYPSLRELRIPGNFLKNYLHKLEALFKNTPLLEILDLSNNGIQSIPPTTLRSLIRLKALNLAKNSLFVTSNLPFHNLPLEYLDMSENSFTYLPETLINNIRKISNRNISFIIDIHMNPFVCDCKSLDFLRWSQTTSTIKHKETLKCKEDPQFGNGSILLVKVPIDELDHRCAPPSMVKLIVAFVVSSASLSILGVLLYRHRWRLRWYYYRYVKNHLKSGWQDNATRDSSAQFDLLILYSETGSQDLAFVKHQLKPLLENDLEYHIFFNGRDDLPGSTKAEEIIRAITQSSKALVLVTPDFTQDSWCDFGIHMLIEHGDLDSRVCLLVDDRVDISSINNKVLKGIMHPSSGIQQVHYNQNTWNDNIHSEMVFKEQLKTFMREDQSFHCHL